MTFCHNVNWPERLPPKTKRELSGERATSQASSPGDVTGLPGPERVPWLASNGNSQARIRLDLPVKAKFFPSRERAKSTSSPEPAVKRSMEVAFWVRGSTAIR